MVAISRSNAIATYAAARHRVGNNGKAWVMLLSVAVASFYAGTVYTLYSGLNNCSHAEIHLEHRIEEMAKIRVQGERLSRQEDLLSVLCFIFE